MKKIHYKNLASPQSAILYLFYLTLYKILAGLISLLHNLLLLISK